MHAKKQNAKVRSSYVKFAQLKDKLDSCSLSVTSHTALLSRLLELRGASKDWLKKNYQKIRIILNDTSETHPKFITDTISPVERNAYLKHKCVSQKRL